MTSVINTIISISSIVGSFLPLNPGFNDNEDIVMPYASGGDSTDCLIFTFETSRMLYKLACKNCLNFTGEICNYVSYWCCISPIELLKREKFLYDGFIPVYKSTCKLMEYISYSTEKRRKLYAVLANKRSVEKERNTAYGVPPKLPDIPEEDPLDKSSKLYYLPLKVCFHATRKVSHRLACILCVPIGQLANVCMKGLRSSKRLKKFIYDLEDYIEGNTGPDTYSNIKKMPNIFLPENLEKQEAAKNELEEYSVIVGSLVYNNPESITTHNSSIRGENKDFMENQQDLEIMLEFANRVCFQFQTMNDKVTELAIRDPTETVPDLSTNIFQLKNRVDQCKKAIEMVKLNLETFNDTNEGQSSTRNEFLDMLPEAFDRVSCEIEKNNEKYKSAQEIL